MRNGFLGKAIFKWKITESTTRISKKLMERDGHSNNLPVRIKLDFSPIWS
jgi:hypothetical protein